MPNSKVRLDLTHDALTTLSLAAERKRGTRVQVAKSDLRALLLDYSRLIRHVGKDNLEGVL